MTPTLTRNERLKKGDFRGIKWAQYGETTHFIIRGRNNQLSLRRIGVSISKKTGSAVARNRMRRLIKEFFRLHKHLFRENTDTSVIVKAIPEKATLQSVGEELRLVLRNTHTL